MINRSMTYNDTYLGGEGYNLLVMESGRFGLSGARVDYQEYGARDGGVTQGATINQHTYIDKCHIYGESKADVYACLDNVKYVLDPRNGAKTLKYDMDINMDSSTDRQYTAVLLSMSAPVWINPSSVAIDLQWMVPSGHAESTTSQSETPTIDADPKTFYIPTDADEAVGGSTFVRPVFTIENTSGGSVTTFTLQNVTRTESLQWSGVLADTHYIRIDSARQHIERSTTGAFGGEETSAISGLTAGNPFPNLSPRVRNEFSLSGFSSAGLTVTYTEEFL